MGDYLETVSAAKQRKISVLDKAKLNNYSTIRENVEDFVG